MNEEQQLRIEAMKIAAQLIRDYKLKDNLISLSKKVYKFLQ
jgi:hypothetical protein